MKFREEQIGECRLILGDCLEVMPTLGRVDAVVTDPPYGIGWKPRVNHQDQKWIDQIDFDIACRRIEEAYKQPRLFKEPVSQPEQMPFDLHDEEAKKSRAKSV